MDKAFVFIDGSNFYFRLKDLVFTLGVQLNLLDFHFRHFLEWLVKPHELIEVRYYVGAVKRQNSDKSERMFADQQRLLARLQQQDVSVTLGQLIRHPDKSYHEKGVDVRLAVEMIRFAREGKFDRAYLISSDTDLVAAVEEVRLLGKKIQYVGTAKGQSFGLSKTCNDTRLIRAEEVREFFPQAFL